MAFAGARNLGKEAEDVGSLVVEAALGLLRNQGAEEGNFQMGIREAAEENFRVENREAAEGED